MFGRSFENEHNALADAIGGARVAAHASFIEKLPLTTVGIELISELLAQRRKKAEKVKATLTRPVHKAWTEQDRVPPSESTPREDEQVTEHPCMDNWMADEEHKNPYTGAKYGPASEAQSKIPDGKLAGYFLMFFSLKTLATIAKYTTQYGFGEWVAPVPGSKGKHPKLVRCKASHPKKQKRYKNWIPIDKWAILCVLGILLYGAGQGWRVRAQGWITTHGGQDQVVTRMMKREAFVQVLGSLHFGRSWGKLGHVKWLLDAVLKASGVMWTLGKHVVVDEVSCTFNSSSNIFAVNDSMQIRVLHLHAIYASKTNVCYLLLYCSTCAHIFHRKHGIKVFVLCCAVTGYIYSWHIYTGKEEQMNKFDILRELLASVWLARPTSRNQLLSNDSRILYTDNWYSSIENCVSLAHEFGLKVVSTFNLSDKVSRGANEYPFAKLRPAALRSVPRGWSRRATRWYKDVPIQAVTWKDRKQVGLVSTTFIGKSPGVTVSRHVSGSKRKEIPACEALLQYTKHYSGVDR